MRKPLHQCRWISGRYCWQKGKTVRERECTPCLVAKIMDSRSLFRNIKPKKNILTLEQWREKNGKRKRG